MSDRDYCAIYSAVFGCKKPQDNDDRALVIRDMEFFRTAKDVDHLRELLGKRGWGFDEVHIVRLWNALKPEEIVVTCPMCDGAGQVKGTGK